MAALNERKIDIVRTLVESAPDRIVGGLQEALAGASADPVLASVRVLVESEARDRLLRNLVLKPVAPLCVGDGTAPHRINFPALALAHLWRGLKAYRPRSVGDVADHLEKILLGEHQPEMLDALSAAAATGLREGLNRDFQQASEICEQVRPGATAELIACLQLAPLIGQTRPKLDGWLSHRDSDTAAAAKVTYRDAMAAADDGGQLFFEMIAAQLPQPWMVLRIISAVMDTPTEKYLRDSELAGFGERLMATVDRALADFAAFDPNAGPAAAREAARLVSLTTRQINELEEHTSLNRSTGWGARVHRQKATLAASVESRLREAEMSVVAVLPMQAGKSGKVTRDIPLMARAPDPAAVIRALTLLTFCDETHVSANYGGFGAARTKIIDRLCDLIDQYVEDALEQVRTGAAPDGGAARALLHVVADFSALLRNEQAADLVRRRAAALFHTVPGQAAAPTSPSP